MRKGQKFYFVELTDTFGGEANYSWVNRYKVVASSFNGAIRKVSKDSFIASVMNTILETWLSTRQLVHVFALLLKSITNCVMLIILV